jgi:uncharacterized DUF497 family protein
MPYILPGMDFEWDPGKADANLAKHGIDLEDAIAVFNDPAVTTDPDPRKYRGESRHRAMGSVDGRVLFVCYTMRDDRCRIISARRASRRERQGYSLHGGGRPQACRPN